LITATISTDLTAAFDTVDMDILLNKLNYYGIRGPEHKLFTNYMLNRKQYVQIDTFNSTIQNSPRCSVFQGSKMSGLLYALYVNEITVIHKLLNNEIYTKMTNEQIIKFNKKYTMKPIIL